MERNNWFKQAINRCKAQTPKVFRRVQYIAGALSAVMIAISTEYSTMGFELPNWWNNVMPYVIGFSTGLVALSQFTQSYGSDGKPVYKHEDYEEGSY